MPIHLQPRPVSLDLANQREAEAARRYQDARSYDDKESPANPRLNVNSIRGIPVLPDAATLAARVKVKK